jgi:hypothetical protein
MEHQMLICPISMDTCYNITNAKLLNTAPYYYRLSKLIVLVYLNKYGSINNAIDKPNANKLYEKQIVTWSVLPPVAGLSALR